MHTHIGNITIGEKEYPMQLNLAFTRYLDEHYVQQGAPMGVGMERLMAFLRIHSMEGIIVFIKAATASEQQKPSNTDIENFINNADDLEWLFERAEEGLKKSQVTRLQAADITELMDKKIEKSQE